MLENFAIFWLFLFSVTVLMVLLNSYGFETSSIIFSAVFSIEIDRFCQNRFWNKKFLFVCLCVRVCVFVFFPTDQQSSNFVCTLNGVYLEPTFSWIWHYSYEVYTQIAHPRGNLPTHPNQTVHSEWFARACRWMEGNQDNWYWTKNLPKLYPFEIIHFNHVI